MYFCQNYSEMQKLAVVTGGTKGIGKAIVEKFLREGYEVAVCARNPALLENRKAETGSPALHIFRADLSRKEEAEAFGDFVLGLGRPIAALINNAGVFIPGKLLEEDENNLQLQLDTNLLSAYYLTRRLIHRIKTAGNAHIFNICSIASLVAYPNSGSYSVSKFALLGFSKSLREELKETGVKVTSVMPGATLTDSWAGTNLPDSRFIKAEDIAEALWAAFSLSSSAVMEEMIIRPQLGDL